MTQMHRATGTENRCVCVPESVVSVVIMKKG